MYAFLRIVPACWGKVLDAPASALDSKWCSSSDIVENCKNTRKNNEDGRVHRRSGAQKMRGGQAVVDVVAAQGCLNLRDDAERAQVTPSSPSEQQKEGKPCEAREKAMAEGEPPQGPPTPSRPGGVVATVGSDLVWSRSDLD